MGLTVGGPNGDPAHVELTGIPLKKRTMPKQSTPGAASS
jgi:hypothetical protein